MSNQKPVESAARIAAERAPVPQIPEGWRLGAIVSSSAHPFHCWMVAGTFEEGTHRAVSGYGDSIFDALTAAIAAAKEAGA